MAIRTFRDEQKSQEFLDELEQLAATGKLEHMVKIFELLYDMLQRFEESVNSSLTIINKNINSLSSKIEKIEAKFEELSKDIVNILDKLSDISETQKELRAEISRIDMNTGGLAEAVLARFFIDSLIKRGAEILEIKRNVRIDDNDIDLLVRAKTEEGEVIYIVEIKVKPKISHVGALLSIVDLYEMKWGVRPKPVLAGVWIGIWIGN